MSNGAIDYPVKPSIDYPNRKLNKLTSFFRIFTVLPIGFVAALFASALPSGSRYTSYSTSNQEVNDFFARYFAPGAVSPDLIALLVAAAFLAPIVLFIFGFIANLFNPIVLMPVFRQKYPKWWFEYYVMLLKFFSRIFSYFMLLTDVYPSTDEEQNVHIEIPYPDAKKDLSGTRQSFLLIHTLWSRLNPNTLIPRQLTYQRCMCYWQVQRDPLTAL
jgi:hypothetical protein